MNDLSTYTLEVAYASFGAYFVRTQRL